MPVERGYEVQTSPRAAAAMPLATAESMGGGVGNALAQAGEQLHNQQVRAFVSERRVKADRELADFSHRYALHRQNMDGIVTELRSNAGPGGAGHRERVKAANEAAREALLGGITEDSVRQRAQAQLDEYDTRLLDTETTFEEGQRVAKRVTDHVDRRDIAANRIRRGVSPDAYAEELRLGLDDIRDAHGLTDAQREKLSKDLEESYGVAFVQNLQDTNPRAARALLDAGQFDHLRPEVLEQLRNGSDVEIRRAEAAAQHEAALGKAQFSEKVATVTERASQGIDVSAELPELIAQASALGDTSTVEKLQGLHRESEFARVWGNASPLQRQSRLQALQAKDGATANEQAEIKWLQDKGGALTSAFNADPVGWAIANSPAGQQPPALDFDDPAGLAASITARQRWARAAAGAYGSMDLLSAAEREALRQRMTQGRAGSMEVANALALFGGRDAKRAAREVAPNDTALHQLVTLPEDYRRRAYEGRDALKANPALLKIDDDRIEEDVNAMTQAMRQALVALPEAEKAAIIETARHIAAGFLGEKGGSLTEDLWRPSLNMALGARLAGGKGEYAGGLGRWNGHYFLAPDGVTPQEFTDRVFAFVRTNPDQGPRNPDGSPASLRGARPVMVAPGVYQFHVGNRAVLGRGRDGKITSAWQFTVNGR